MNKVSITFVKDHPSGIKEGKTCLFSESKANELVEQGYAILEGAETQTEEPKAKPVGKKKKQDNV